ncbi:FAD-dependent monooxygenase [Thauera butanivorans]|uniref:FAD-dependent monooxygenase n=1 Tax=Thauera butanivorans TaxID=86174 RepID=UPI000A00BE8F|nr:FAD-dependent monooxygenase [Thauera butanivorans]
MTGGGSGPARQNSAGLRSIPKTAPPSLQCRSQLNIQETRNDASAKYRVYYNYRIYPARLPSGPEERKRVVIVGGGPVGLTTALTLARYGVPSVLLESEQQVSEGSRAIVFTRRSMEILQQAGVADRISAAGLPWRFGNSFYRGQRVFRMEAPHDADDRYYPMINLQQQYLEEFLVDAAEAHPLIELRWGNKVLGVEQAADHARVEIDTPAGPYTLETDWLVAADGARSVIRTMMGLGLEGASYEGRFVIADIRIDVDLPTERLAFFDPSWNPGNTVLMHREPGNIWRVDYQLPADETPEQALQPDSLKARIDAQLRMIGVEEPEWEMDWCSVYSARTLTLPDYVHGRVIFTGDAAHILPIFGVRGANTGFQDGFDLSWKLAFAIQGWGTEKLLRSYSAERVKAAREIIDEAGKSIRFMTPPSDGFRLLRDAVLSLKHDFVRPLFHWRTSRPHEYSDSMLNSLGDDNALFHAGPADGAPLMNVRLGSDGFLFDHFGPALHLLMFAEIDAVPAPILAEVEALRARGVPVRIIVVRRGRKQAVEGADAAFGNESGHFWEKYGVLADGAAYLVRPDQHVCARWKNLSPDRLRAALNTVLGNS